MITERTAIMSALTLIVFNVSGALQRLGIPDPEATSASQIEKDFADPMLVALWSVWKTASDILKAMHAEPQPTVIEEVYKADTAGWGEPPTLDELRELAK